MKDLTGKGKPFHSALDKAAALLKRKVGTGAEFMKELQGLGGIKQAEMDERKLAELMGMPKMTHEQFMAALAARPVPAIGEKVFGEAPSQEDVIREANKDIRHYAGEYASDNADTSGEYRRLYAEEAARLRGKHRGEITRSAKEYLTAPTHHDEYTLPGGENYREMLIKAPKFDKERELNELYTKVNRANPVGDVEAMKQQLAQLQAEKARYPERFAGVSHHFGGEPDILASMRLKDRLGPNGEKLLHLEELQSDWHQQGREKGYHDPEKLAQAQATVDALKAEHKRLGEVKAQAATPEEREAISEQRLAIMGQIRDATIMPSDHVPDAPFKKNWEEMALKRLIHHAAEKGYHGIVVTPGAEQADRYSLAKHIDDLHYSGSNLVAYDPEGNEVIKRTGVRPQDLPELVGKELADKLMAQEPKGTLRSLSGVDLQVGGEGMKGFYDKKVPNILNAIGKKHGVKTQLHGHTVHGRGRERSTREFAQAIRDAGHDINNLTLDQQKEFDYEPKPIQLHHFPITENMRKDILTNGLPLYKEGGIIRKAEGGNVQLTVDQMRQQLMAAGKPLQDISQIGAQEAPSMPVKNFIIPQNGALGSMPMGGVDMSPQQPGQQMLPANLMQPQPNPLMPQQPQAPAPAPQAGSNILQMTPQGQKMAALSGSPQGNLPTKPAMAIGGSVPTPVNNHPFQSAGDRPIPFMAKVGGSDNMPMDNQSMDNGATTFNIDNIQELADGGNVQGYASKGYVVHEPKNPHPEVGTRYKAVQLPGLMPEHPVDLEQLHRDRASIQLRPWDATNRHVNVTNVSGHDLLNPLTTEGGQPFARDIELNKKGIVSASNEGIQRKIQGRANTAHEENIKQGGHGHTYDIISTMDAPAPFFTHMPLHIQLDLLKQRQLKPEQLKELADKVRAIKVRDQKSKKVLNPYANMLPLDHPELWDQMMKGGHGIGAPGKLRTALSATLGQVAQQKLLDYNLPDLMNAITEEEIRKAPATYAGNTFLANVPYADVGPQHHTIYDKSGYGEYGGKGPQMPAELYMTEVYDRILAEMQKKHPKAGASALRALTIGALQTRAGGVSQMVNDRVLRNAERFTKDTKSGEIADPNDLWNVIGHFHKKYGGYKDGGGVKKSKVTDNLDTMRLALTKNSKKAK